MSTQSSRRLIEAHLVPIGRFLAECLYNREVLNALATVALEDVGPLPSSYKTVEDRENALETIRRTWRAILKPFLVNEAWQDNAPQLLTSPDVFQHIAAVARRVDPQVLPPDLIPTDRVISAIQELSSEMDELRRQAFEENRKRPVSPD